MMVSSISSVSIERLLLALLGKVLCRREKETNVFSLPGAQSKECSETETGILVSQGREREVKLIWFTNSRVNKKNLYTDRAKGIEKRSVMP
jgi:hypothetical protein